MQPFMDRHSGPATAKETRRMRRLAHARLVLLFAIGTSAAAPLSACSFRSLSHVTGAITALSVSGGGAPGLPITLTAEAVYGGDFREPSLSVVLNPSTPRTIRVQAVADWAEPFMGLGVFVTPVTSTRSAVIKSTVTLQEPGRYTVESLQPDGYGRAIVHTTIDLEGN